MSAPMSPERMAEIAARAEAATPPPWHGEHLPDPGDCVVVGDYGWVTPGPSSPEYDVLSEQGHADAEFIAHAREDVPSLLAEVERLRSRLAARPSRAQVLRETAEDLRVSLARTVVGQSGDLDIVLGRLVDMADQVESGGAR